MKEITKKTILENLRFFIGTMLFMAVASMLFGTNNTLTWVGSFVALTMYTKMNIGIDKKQAPIVILGLFLFIGISNRLAMFHPVLGIFINLITIFIIMYVPSSKPEQKEYMPFILCYIFGETMPASGTDFLTRMASLLVGGMLVAIVYYFSHRKSQEKQATIQEMIKSVNPISDRFILAIKMAIGVSIAMLIGTLLHLNKTLWIACSVMSITQINFEHTKQRFKYRILATILGSVLFIVLFKYLVPQQYTAIATLVLGYIYTFIKDYQIQIVFVTINALCSAMVLFDGFTAAGLRIVLVIVGCILAYIINQLDFKKFASWGHIFLNNQKDASLS